MRKSNRFLRLLVAAVLVLVGVSALAAVSIQWQGMKSLMPTPVFWGSEASVNGKIYIFGGTYRDSKGNQVMTGAVQIYDTATDTWSTGASMPTVRYLSTAVEVGGKIYVMGGRTTGVANAGPVDANEVYDPATNGWTAKAKMPAPIRGHAAAAYNGKIYVFGGNTTAYQSAVNIYDPASDTWSTGAAMPQALAYGAAVTVGSKIYWIGGDFRTVSVPADVFGAALVYDPVANSWSSNSIPMYQPVDFAHAAADPASGRIYMFGGEYLDTSITPTPFQVPTEICQALDTASGAFRQINTMPNPLARSEAFVAESGGSIYILGGNRSSYFADEQLGTVEVYDPATDTYYQPNAVVPNYGWFGGVAGEIGGKIVAAHGASQAADGKVDLYDIASNTWSTSQSADPTPQYYSVGGVYNGQLVVSGGVTGSQAPTGATALYDPATDTWTALAPDPTARFLAAGCVLDGKLYVFGGDTNWSSSKLVATLDVLDLASNTWSTKKSLPKPMRGMVALPFGGKIYLFGGAIGDISKSTGFNTQTLVYDPAADSYDTSLAAMPMPSVYAAGAAYGNYLFVGGGYYWQAWANQSAVGIVKDIQVYDASANTWTTVEGLFNRLNHNMVASDGTLYVFNGLDPDYPADRLNIGTISGVSAPLSATASADKASGTAPLTVAFTGSASGGTAPYTYDWDFGDGSAHGTTASVSHTFQTGGTYSVLFTVTDSASATASKTLTITVSAPVTNPPVVTSMRKAGSPFRFIVMGSNFQSGIQVFIGNDATPWPTVTQKGTTKLVIKGGASLKAKVPKGTPTLFTFKNTDGGSATTTFSW